MTRYIPDWLEIFSNDSDKGNSYEENSGKKE